MSELWVWLDIWKNVLGAIAAIVTAAAVLWRVLRRPLRNILGTLKHMYYAREYHDGITEKLDTIMLQLVPNGGSSIRDSLDRIEHRQHVLGAFQKAQLNAHVKAMFEADKSGKWGWVNRPHNRLSGYQAEEMLGDGWINAVAPECREITMRKWEDAVSKNREFDENVWFIKSDKQTRYKVHIHAYTVLGIDGRVEGYLGEITDLHESQMEPLSCAEYIPTMS